MVDISIGDRWSWSCGHYTKYVIQSNLYSWYFLSIIRPLSWLLVSFLQHKWIRSSSIRLCWYSFQKHEQPDLWENVTSGIMWCCVVFGCAAASGRGSVRWSRWDRATQWSCLKQRLILSKSHILEKKEKKNISAVFFNSWFWPVNRMFHPQPPPVRQLEDVECSLNRKT